MILHDFLPSGNGYKVRLLCACLGLKVTLKEYDITKGETHTKSFLAMNPNGKIPVLELDDGQCLSESSAVLLYIKEQYEQYSHEPNFSPPRFWLTHNAMTLADICLFPYTHVAEEGGAYQLSEYPNIQRWIKQIEALDWFIPITQG